MSIESKIRSIVKFAQLTLASKDDGIDSIFQIEGIGKPINCQSALPYGFSANVPKDCTVLVFSAGGSAQNPVGIPTMNDNRFRDLKEWEVKIGNYKTKANIHFKEDGTIELKSGKDGGNLKFENSSGNGSIEITNSGDVVLNGGTDSAVKGDTFKVEYDAHVHPTAFGPSGVTVPITAASLETTVKL